MVAALLKEMELQRDYLDGDELTSVYLGGGTPSLLETGDLVRLFEQIARIYRIAPDAEITLEANPDDLTREKLQGLRHHTPVNRLSIGIQSFSEDDLRWMHRAHNAADARACLDEALSSGFNDLTVDLIYGSPTTSDAQWTENLEIAFGYDIPHLSCYCLTVEEGTALGAFVRKGQQPPVDEEKAARQFEYLMEAAAGQGYEHYEISNFAMPGRYARHNSSYWRGEKYLGVGPSAHSFDGKTRQWNIANNALYIKSIEQGVLSFERELLTPEQRYNEYVMTSLRTMWGTDLKIIREMGGPFETYFLHAVTPFIRKGEVERSDDLYRLSPAGKLLADRIASELFMLGIKG